VRVGSLFSGAGLGDLGWMMAGFEIMWQVENDKYCQKILDLRFPESKKYYDIKTLKGCEVEPVDIVAGGFPCQPFSVAGNQRGDQDDRNLWPEMLRVIKEVRPTWVVGENVSGLIPIYLDTILDGLEGEGYSTRTFVFPAYALGAAHRRERIWVVGYSEYNGRNRGEKRGSITEVEGKRRMQESKGHGGSPKNLADTEKRERRLSSKQWKEGSEFKWRSEDVPDSIKRSKRRTHKQEENRNKHDFRHDRNAVGDDIGNFRRFWKAEPPVGRVVNGCPSRVDRLKALGNGQVVACTAFIGRKIMEFERVTKYADKTP